MKKVEIKKIQQWELEVLTVFDTICRQNDIKYSLSGGTLLGAIRHKGFIPWDDDVDVLMTREAYTKFLNICKEQLPPNYFIQTNKTDDNYPLSFAKLRNQEYRVTVQELINLDVQNGVCIDIFPIDRAYDNFILDYIQRTLISICDIVKLSCLKEKNSTKVKALLKKVIQIFAKIIKIKNICLIDEKIRINSSSRHEYTYADFMPPAYKLKRTQRFKWDIFEHYCEVEFEGHSFMAIRDYDLYLSRWYGNYMKLPPKEKRIPDHNFILVE